ncbi:MAG TPA: 30S ribosome-binding factor RbfA [Chromatiales bacterium]|nr:30S ribosome-binding factor RbfA [Chromatiales bacterium]
MPRDYPRTLRVGEQIRRELADLLRDEVKDPRVAGVTLLDVQVSRDLGHAKVYYSVLEDDPQHLEAVQQGLERAAGFLRGQLGRRMHVRTVPQLHFVYDETEKKAAALEDLIRRSLHKD